MTLNSKNPMIKYSIIVPVKNINDYIGNHVHSFEHFKRKDLELIVLPDESLFHSENSERIRYVLTGSVSPAVKRDIGVNCSSGKYIVFLDDDAYVEEQYFSTLDTFYQQHTECAVGGPASTPLTNNVKQKASGAVYEDRFLSSDPKRYLSQGSRVAVDDWPSVNLSIPRELFLRVGGFNQVYWPGEDTMFCRKLIKEGVHIFYEPTLVAYHHRRGSLRSHLKQSSGYGYHRGHFARYFPENSRRWKYFVPTLFTGYTLLALVVLILLQFLAIPKYLVLLTYLPGFCYCTLLASAIVRTFKRHSLLVAVCVSWYFPLTHFVYGLRFIRGFAMGHEFQSRLA
jgi:GT2 family glycosyltransferase